MTNLVKGFSKLSKEEKINWIVENYLNQDQKFIEVIKQYWNLDNQLQQLHDDFIENTISNFYFPLGVAPNFLINGKNYLVPMAIEESSVVAAASKSAKFWSERGGFKATVLNTEKIGQVHFIFNGNIEKLYRFFDEKKSIFFDDTTEITKNMQKRGGGILDIELRNKTDLIPNYFQLHATFETIDSMGANFINSCLEQFGKTLQREALAFENFNEEEKKIQVVMAILSNYVDNCIVRVEVSCKIEELADKKITSPVLFAEKFVQAIRIAEVETYRAVTHNKGIMNGIDAVVIATGNDFRAVEAGVHAYAAKDGRYTSLSHAKIENDIFYYWMEIPLALGTVGGLTNLHPLVKMCFNMLGNPSAKELMQVVATAGLAQNFAALRSLITNGIQEGHMKMHLGNILNQMKASEDERQKVQIHFENNIVSHAAVVSFIENLRN